MACIPVLTEYGPGYVGINYLLSFVFVWRALISIEIPQPDLLGLQQEHLAI
jgi:hypothetical protein